MKNIIKATLLMAVMLICTVLASSCSEEPLPPDAGGKEITPSPSAELTYELIANGTEYEVTGIKAEDTRTFVEIPSEYNAIPVTSIANKAFAGTSITEVKIGARVTKIGTMAFDGCTYLTKVTFGESLDKIGNYSFRNCTALTSPEFNSRLTYISSYAFMGCTAIENVVIPDNVTYMGVGAFSGCTSVNAVSVGSGLAKIPDEAFYNCQRLKFASFSEGLTDIGNKAFEKCRLVGITKLDFPSSLKTIGDAAFKNCVSLSELTLGENLIEIGKEAFMGCTALYKVRGTVVGTSDRSFSGCTRLTLLTLGTRKVNKKTYGLEIGYEAFMGCTALSLVKIEEGVTQIGYASFMNCTTLESVIIPKSIFIMGQGAWQGCRSLSAVYYMGTPEQFLEININSTGADYFWNDYSQPITGAPRYYYSEESIRGGDTPWLYNHTTGKYTWEFGWEDAEPRYWRFNSKGKPVLWG